MYFTFELLNSIGECDDLGGTDECKVEWIEEENLE